jgi:hypothetical protein
VREGCVGHGLYVLDALARGSLCLEGASVLDRERGTVGDQLEQLDLVGPENPSRERADMEDAAC